MLEEVLEDFYKNNEVVQIDKFTQFIQRMFNSANILFDNDNKMHQKQLAEYIIKNNATCINVNIIKISIENYLRENNQIIIISSNNVHCRSDIGSKLLLDQVKRSIIQCNNLLEFQKLNGEDLTDVLRLKNMLLNQSKEIKLKRISSHNRSQTPIEEKSLKEIFSFYCKQQFFIGEKPTFEQMSDVLKNMNLGEFMKLCKDFNIDLPFLKIKEIFKKTARLSKELDWERFKVIFHRISNELVDQKIKIGRAHV